MATPPPSRKRQRHQHSRHRSTSTDDRSRDRIRRRHRSSSTDERSRDRIWRWHRSTSRDERARGRIQRSHRDTHLRRSRSRDKHSRHRTRSRRHDSTSRPRYTSYHRLERRNRRGSRERHQSSIVQYDRSCPLLLYKHFIYGLDVAILPDEAHRRYEPYLRQLKQAFFSAHKDDQRLKHMYHPSHIQTAIHKRNENAKAVAKNFFQDLKNGTLVYLRNCSPKNAVRHLKELNQARSLIAKVDAEKGIEDNLLLSSGQDGSFAQFIPVKKPDDSITTLAGIELLNLVRTYLWYVHEIDYYGMAEKGKDLITREDNLSPAEQEQMLDSVWQARLQARDPLHASLGKDKLECLVNQNLCAHFTMVEKERGDGHIKTRYVCKQNSCGKRCKALGNIIQHIHDEHCEVVEGYSVQAMEEMYFENYMNDPCAPCTVTGG